MAVFHVVLICSMVLCMERHKSQVTNHRGRADAKQCRHHCFYDSHVDNYSQDIRSPNETKIRKQRNGARKTKRERNVKRQQTTIPKTIYLSCSFHGLIRLDFATFSFDLDRRYKRFRVRVRVCILGLCCTYCGTNQACRFECKTDLFFTKNPACL